MTTPIIITGQSETKREERIVQFLNDLSVKKANTYRPNVEKLGISEVRDFENWLNITSGSVKALIIEKADRLTVEAQNAFLKTLEEPPDNALIIFETQNCQIFLPTVLSRMVVIDTGSLTPLEPKTINDLQENFSTLDSDLGQKFALAQKIGKREDAIIWVDNAIRLLSQNLRNNSKSAFRLHNLLITKRQLQANTNVRLTLENLFLKW